MAMDFVKTVDTVIVGRKTYDKVISMGFDFPHADKDAYIITRTPRPTIGSVKFYSGDLKTLVGKLKTESGKNIYCDGGAEIVNELLKDNLIDEFIISVIPILVGNGTKLFKDNRPEQKLELVSVKSFDKRILNSTSFQTCRPTIARINNHAHKKLPTSYF